MIRNLIGETHGPGAHTRVTSLWPSWAWHMSSLHGAGPLDLEDLEVWPPGFRGLGESAPWITD